jgi:hypothetical protein
MQINYSYNHLIKSVPKDASQWHPFLFSKMLKLADMVDIPDPNLVLLEQFSSYSYKRKKLEGGQAGCRM